jgi:siroheme synthase-like protein
VKAYEDSDLEGADYVLAATNDRQINHKIYEACRTAGVPVNVADDKGKSDFYFPGIIRKNGITVGVTAEGRDHALAKKATGVIRGCLEQELHVDTESQLAQLTSKEDGKIGS